MVWCLGWVSLRNEHADHAVLPRGDEELALAADADMQIGPRRLGAQCLVDELLQRYIHAFAVSVTHIELYLFDRRHGLRDAVIGLLHGGKIGGEQTPTLNVAEHEFAA